jgi:hypothetical protein
MQLYLDTKACRVIQMHGRDFVRLGPSLQLILWEIGLREDQIM